MPKKSFKMEMTKIYYNRKSLRLNNYNYAENGMYYVTICTKNRENILSEIKLSNDYCRGRVPPLPNEKNIVIKYTTIGEMIENTIKNINRKHNCRINNYIIMPNHIHLVVQINNDLGRGGTLPLHGIIGRFKSFTTKQYNLLNNTIGKKMWQRNYYEHVIRNEKEYYQICNYINNNPIRYLLRTFGYPQ